MGHNYRFLYADALTGALLGELPVESASFSWVLNGPGAFRGVLPLRPRAPDAVATITEASFFPNRTLIYVERDGAILWGGFLLTLEADVGENSLVAGGEGWLSYWRRRTLRTDKAYAAVDQALIAKDLIDYARSVPGSAGIDTSGMTATGVLRDRTWFAYEGKKVGALVEDLAKLEGGFDLGFDFSLAGGVVTPRMLTRYPATGRKTDHVFEVGNGVEVLSLQIDGTAQAWQVHGSGSNPSVNATSVDPSMVGAVPLLEEVLSFPDVQDGTTIKAKTDARLSRTRNALKLPRLAVTAGAIPELGSYIEGDQVRVVGSYGFLSLDGIYRLTEVSVTVDDGAETVGLVVAPLEAFVD